MTTVTAAHQLLIDKLAAIAVLTPAGDSEAKQIALVSAAITQLSSGVSLEAEILASIQAILDSFDAQNATAVAELEAANLLLAAAKDDLVTNAASLTDTNTKVTANIAAVAAAKAVIDSTKTVVDDTNTKVTVSKAYLETLMDTVASKPMHGVSSGRNAISYQFLQNSYDSNNWHLTFGVRPPLFDARDGSLYLVHETSSGSQVTTVVQRYKDGIYTNCFSVTQDASANQGWLSIYLLPLARSATDPTTVISCIIMHGGNPGSGGWQTVNVRKADNWATNRAVTADVPVAAVCHGYDYTNKTFVYLAGASGSAPWSTYPVKEMFADATARNVTIPATPRIYATEVLGSGAFANYIHSDKARFFNINGPSNQGNTTFTLNSLYRCYKSTLESVQSSSAPDYLIMSYQTPFNDTYGVALDGAMRGHQTGRGQPSQNSYAQRNTNPGAVAFEDVSYFGSSSVNNMQGRMFATPQWSVAANGSVTLLSIRYTPEYDIQAFNMGNSTQAYLAYEIGVKSTRFSVQDIRTGKWVAMGNIDAMIDPSCLTGYYSNAWNNSSRGMIYQKYGMFHLHGINLTNLEGFVLVGGKFRQQPNANSDTGQAGYSVSGTTYYTHALYLQPIQLAR